MFGATITDAGLIHPDAVNQTAGRLIRWKRRHVNVVVSRYVKPKSNPQLALYFGPVIEAWCDFTGYDPAEMDTELRRAYLAPQLAIARLTGEETKERPRLRDLDVEEMTVFLERVLREGRQLGITFRLDGD